MIFDTLKNLPLPENEDKIPDSEGSDDLCEDSKTESDSGEFDVLSSMSACGSFWSLSPVLLFISGLGESTCASILKL